VTHALRTTEYNDRDAQYKWLQNALELRPVHIYTYGKINFVHTVLSKRKLTWFVESKLVEGWDDPRFPTVQGCVRRGVDVEALKRFIIMQGASRRVITMEWDKFWAENKKVLEEKCARYMAVDVQNAALLIIENFNETLASGGDASSVNEHLFTVPIHPQKPELGSRLMRRAQQVLLDAIDAAVLKEGDTVTLLRWGNVIISRITRDGDGIVTHIYGTYDHTATNFSKTRKLSWLAVSPSNVEVQLVEFDHLISKAKIEEDEDFKQFVNPVTLKEVGAIADAALRHLTRGTVIQLERKGFYRLDREYDISTNKPPQLFAIPDGRVK
jgi:glutamyl-tRNA synthetase